MKWWLFVGNTSAALVLAPSLFAAGFEPLPDGRNCGLDEAPAAAVRKILHGNQMSVFPATLDRHYDGCQTIWVGDGTSWKAMYVSVYKSGKRIAHAARARVENEVSETVCFYGDGDRVIRKDIGSAVLAKCPQAASASDAPPINY